MKRKTRKKFLFAALVVPVLLLALSASQSSDPYIEEDSDDFFIGIVKEFTQGRRTLTITDNAGNELEGAEKDYFDRLYKEKAYHQMKMFLFDNQYSMGYEERPWE